MDQRTCQRGLTMIELVVVLLIFLMLVLAAQASWRDLVPRQALVARANNIVGLIYHARETAAEGHAVLICAAGSDCTAFEPSKGLVALVDRNRNQQFDERDEVLATLRLPEGMQVVWRSFRAKPWLQFDNRASAWYQNGHFLLCYRDHTRKVILTRIGRPRVDPTRGRGDCPR